MKTFVIPEIYKSNIIGKIKEARRTKDKLKKDFTGWRAALFCSEDAPWRMIGLRPSKRIPLMNGSIKTKLFIYEMYSGSKKNKSEAIVGDFD